MSATTPRTDGAAYRVWGIENVNASLSRTLETELTAANARIAELEKESRDVPLCADHTEAWFCHHNFKPGDCWFCELSNQILSLTRQLSESQAQLADMTDAWDKIFDSRRINGMSHTEAAKALIARNEKLREENELLNQLVRGGSCLSCKELSAQLASARENCKELHRIVDAAAVKLNDAALGHLAGRTSPPASAEPGPASTWQPIETAPRDGTEVLFVNKWGGFRLGFYSKVWANFVTTLGAPLRNIVHWQPLPPPPTQDGKQTK